MLGALTEREIDGVLCRQRIGRVGSTAVGHVHVTPIVYGYDGNAIYGHSRFGHKIQYMRGNHEVCFEVEEIVDPTSWRVVVLTAWYEELTEIHERDRAMRLILAQAGGGPESEAVHVEDAEDLIVFRLRILMRTGRFERPIDEPVSASTRVPQPARLPRDANPGWHWT